MPRAYTPHESWTLAFEEGLLILHGGADRLFLLDRIDASSGNELVEQWKRGSVDPACLNGRATELVGELVEVGALVRPHVHAPPLGVAWRWAGRPHESLESELRRQMDACSTLECAPPDVAGVLLLLRTDAALADVCTDDYEGLELPHLLVDMAYDHNLSLGPLVFPNETACVGCLVGRVLRRWGDPPPPPEPRALSSPFLLAAITVRALERFAAGDYALANSTTTLDLDRLTARTDPLYRLPWCPWCSAHRGLEDVGAVALPWLDAA